MATQLAPEGLIAQIAPPTLLWLTAIPLGLVILALVWCWRTAHRRSQSLLSLTGLSQSIAATGLAPLALYNVISSYIQKVIQAPTLILEVSLDPDKEQTTIIANGELMTRPEERQAVGTGTFEWLQKHRSPLLVRDLSRNTPIIPYHLDGPVNSAIYMPILADERLLGALALQSPHKGAFDRHAQASLELAADQIALGMQAADMYRKEQERTAQLLMIAEVSRKVAAILDLDTLFSDTVRLVQETFGYYHVSIFSIDVEACTIQLQASSSPYIEEIGLYVPWGKGLIGHAARGETILVSDVQQDERYLAAEVLEKTAAELVLPLMVEDRVLGVLDLQSDCVGSFREGDVSILRILADQIAVAIEDSRLYRAQQEQAWISTALLQVAEAVAEKSTLKEITETVSRLAQLLTGVEQCDILMWSAEDEAFVLPTPHPSMDPTAMNGSQSFPVQEIPMLQQLQSEQTSTVGTLGELGQLARIWSPETPPDAQALGLPLITKGEIIGALIALTPTNGELPAAQRTVLEGIARQASLGLDNAMLLSLQQEEAWVSTALLQVANVIANASYDLSETASTIVRLLPMLVGISWCAILVRDEDTGQYIGMSSFGLDREFQERGNLPTYDPKEIVGLTDSEGTRELDELSPALLHDLSLGQRDEPRDTVLPLSLGAHGQDLGILLVGPTRGSDSFSGRRLAILNGIAGQTALAISATRLYEQSVAQERTEHEMRLARDIQASFLPEACPDIPGWLIAVDWRAARGVGGDYYDFVQPTSRQLGISIADVSDKGVPAALYMALSRTVLRTAALDLRGVGDFLGQDMDIQGPAETLYRTNRILLQDSRSGMFVTAVYGVIDLETGLFRYARAGHNPPLLLPAAGNEIKLLNPPGIALGVVDRPNLVEDTVMLAPGDTLVLYTDGVTEAFDEHGCEFGMERLLTVIHQHADLAPQALIEQISEAVRQFVGSYPQSDDYTVLIIQREPLQS